MKQLTGLDASFLYMETPTTFGHVNGLGIYERPSDDFDPYEAVYNRFKHMIGIAEPLRRRLIEVPFQLDHPYWINDPEFDLDYHVRHIGLAPPGAADQLAEQVSRIIGRPMDRSHPLWEVYVMEGLADGRWAMLTKTHHATIDGASGVMFLQMLCDTDPDAENPAMVDWTPEPIPTDAALLQRTAMALASNPAKGLRLQFRMMRNMADAAGIEGLSTLASRAGDAVRTAARGGRERKPSSADRVTMPLTSAPPTPWNKAITAHRRFAMRSTALDNVKRLKDATGGTLNDVVMAVCAGALRSYLIKHDALPDEPLRAMVPVSIRTGEETDPWTNRVSGIVAELPTNVADPLERVKLAGEAMDAAKRQFELVPAEAAVDSAEAASPIVAQAATRMVSSLRLADRMNMPANVVISNVPGPRKELYFAGAKLNHYFPVSTIAEGMGLNITVHSYLDRLDIGLVACRELIPDLWDLVDMHIDEIKLLFEATGAEWAEEQTPPAMRRGDTYTAPKPMRESGKELAKKNAKKTTKATAKKATKKGAKKRSTKKAAKKTAKK